MRTLTFPLLADWVVAGVCDLRPGALRAAGITLLLTDLDNTLAPYGAPEPDGAVRDWAAALEAAGVRLFLLSNSRKPSRPARFAQALGIPYLGHAGKPRPGGFFQAMDRMGARAEETAIVGDQIFTDILGGRRAGVRTILVEPIRLAGNPGRYVRYAAEWPFRALSRQRRR